jgi:hypothetical protein
MRARAAWWPARCSEQQLKSFFSLRKGASACVPASRIQQKTRAWRALPPVWPVSGLARQTASPSYAMHSGIRDSQPPQGRRLFTVAGAAHVGGQPKAGPLRVSRLTARARARVRAPERRDYKPNKRSRHAPPQNRGQNTVFRKPGTEHGFVKTGVCPRFRLPLCVHPMRRIFRSTSRRRVGVVLAKKARAMDCKSAKKRRMRSKTVFCPRF